MQNSKYHTLDVKKTCENKLGIIFKKGKEFNGWFYLNGRKPIPPKTYKSMAIQLGLNIGEFDDLLECPLRKDRYEKIISE
ncbi:hypothetical protein QUF80_15065 [Desulfococcaceae bacterium HSG8]|nr:hypothetical protein [Desulfococcaceae bacterium HSG8]